GGDGERVGAGERAARLRHGRRGEGGVDVQGPGGELEAAGRAGSDGGAAVDVVRVAAETDDARGGRKVELPGVRAVGGQDDLGAAGMEDAVVVQQRNERRAGAAALRDRPRVVDGAESVA